MLAAMLKNNILFNRAEDYDLIDSEIKCSLKQVIYDNRFYELPY